MAPKEPITTIAEVDADLLEQINSGSTYEELFDRLYERLHPIIPYNRIAIALLDQTGEELQLVSCRSDGETVLNLGYADKVNGSTLAHLLEQGQPRIINDLEAYLQAKPSSRSTRLIVREGMRSNLTLPLIANGSPIGVIFFSSREKRTYSEDHSKLLKQVAGHIAITIEKAKLLAALEEQNKELLEANRLKDRFLQRLQEEVEKQTHDLRASEQHHRLLANIGQIVSSSLDLSSIFQSSAHEIHQLLHCDRVSLILVSNGSRRGFAIDFRKPSTVIEIPNQPLRQSAAEWVISHRQSRIVPDLEKARPFIEDQKLFDLGYSSYLYLPLICREEVIGIWGIATSEKEAIATWSLSLLHDLCSILATALDNATAYEQIASLTARLEQENVYLRDAYQPSGPTLVGQSAALQGAMAAIDQVAPTDSTVLITGETGTGKERVAEAIHERSPRREHLLVKVNCAALSKELIVSELFGHEAGAFTGAMASRAGRFEIAHRGTLFLDEIAEVPLEVQVLLLRALQEKVIERVGSNEPREVDARVNAATNRDLQAGVTEGWFRADLFYRLFVFPIEVPPLRERKDDIPLLAAHFVERLSHKMKRSPPKISEESLELLVRYHWPGNVRELENLIERALIVSNREVLNLDPAWLPQLPSPPTGKGLANVERQAIVNALRECNGKIYGTNGAAARLGLKPSTLYGKMRKHGISKEDGST